MKQKLSKKQPFTGPAAFRALGHRGLVALLVALVAGALVGCGQNDTDDRTTADQMATGPAPAADQREVEQADDSTARKHAQIGPEADAANREAAASHILFMYAGSRGAGPQITRSRSEADDAARRAHVLLRTNRASFEELARKYSNDQRTRDRAGYIGIFRRGEMTLPFEQVVFGLEEEQISGVIETAYGFHIIRREPVRRYRLHHVLIAWQDARKNATRSTRNHDEAEQLAERIRQKAINNRDEFCRLARKYSDDPGNRAACGDLGWIEPGTLSPEIEAVVFKLRPDAISAVIESPYGFHVFWRRPG